MVRPGVRGRRGATLIEFAIVLLLLLLLIFAIVEFGRYFFVQHSLQFATREGVRLALVGRTLSDPSGNPLSREASIVKMITDKAAMAVRASDLQISIYPISADYTDPANWQNVQDAGEPGSYMRVRTRYYFTFTTPVIGAFAPGGRLLVEAQATYRNELFQQ